MSAGQYIKATLTLVADGHGPADRTTDSIFMGSGDPGGDVMLAFQVDATGFDTGEYRYDLAVDYYESDHDLIGTITTEDVNTVSVVNRVYSPFGNRWWQDGVDQLVVQTGSDTRPAGALFVNAKGTALFYPETATALTYSAADGDPEFATLTHSSGTFTLTSRDGTVRTFYVANDVEKQLITRTDADGNTTTYGYNSTTDKLETIEDSQDRVTQFEYFTSGTYAGQLEKITDIYDQVTNFEYDRKTVIENADPTPDVHTFLATESCIPIPMAQDRYLARARTTRIRHSTTSTG